MASPRIPPIWHVFRFALLAFGALAALGLITELTRAASNAVGRTDAHLGSDPLPGIVKAFPMALNWSGSMRRRAFICHPQQSAPSTRAVARC
jgi:hypothetical protein